MRRLLAARHCGGSNSALSAAWAGLRGRRQPPSSLLGERVLDGLVAAQLAAACPAAAPLATADASRRVSPPAPPGLRRASAASCPLALRQRRRGPRTANLVADLEPEQPGQHLLRRLRLRELELDLRLVRLVGRAPGWSPGRSAWRR